MMQMKALRAMVIAIAVATPFAAQSQEVDYDRLIAEWAKGRGEIVTPSAQKAALKAAAEGFSTKAISAGLNHEAADKIALAITDAGYVVAKPHGVTAKWSTGEYTFAWEDSGQFEAISKALEPELIYASLDRFPSIIVVVEPVPPVDYVTEINGETVTSVEKGVYRVDPGDVVVRVTRPTHPDCLWKGTLETGAKQQVDCKL
ncbi:hypothetical protein [Mesorhizobium sp. LNHC209A00]|uniref:hypothetical protein n=1 Tax=Mesorhizobium TaxID=68287 RepID=UPI0003CFCFA1|nr:hypothetical protein [Mesorhizobium sp. LNHC209A00]ESY94860.1 hypothetical protein X738_23210 [Mesorhizobium sp. LNHC209A00]